MNMIILAESVGANAPWITNKANFVPGAFGGLVLELLYLQIYKQRANQKSVKALLSSPLYWLCVSGMCMASGIVALFMHPDSSPGTTGLTTQLFMTGIAARTIVRELVSIGKPKAKLTLGDPEKVSLQDIFS